jgi:lipoprotein-anchoring transpeptidase ErfK/SrfK
MKRFAANRQLRNLWLLGWLALSVAPAAWAQEIVITWPGERELVEGRTYTLEWLAGGASTVNILIDGMRTPLGAKSRGPFVIVLATGVPAAEGEYEFVLPWIDVIEFRIKIKGYDPSGYQVSIGERSYAFRPAVLADRTADGIYLDLHERTNQRLYVQKDRRITRVYLSSSSENYLWTAPDRHLKKPHDHAGVFKVLEKRRTHWSRLYQVQMPWSMRYHVGHYIHATSPNLYPLLGRPASHGCNRLTREDARELYEMTPIGTRVEVIGPIE